MQNTPLRSLVLIGIALFSLLLASCGTEPSAEDTKWADKQKVKIEELFAKTNGTVTHGEITVSKKDSSFIIKDIKGSLVLPFSANKQSEELSFEIAELAGEGVNFEPAEGVQSLFNKLTFKNTKYSLKSSVEGKLLSESESTMEELVYEGFEVNTALCGALVDLVKNVDTLSDDDKKAAAEKIIPLLQGLQLKKAISKNTTSTVTAPGLGFDKKLVATIATNQGKDFSIEGFGATSVNDVKITYDDTVATIAECSFNSVRLEGFYELLNASVVYGEDAPETLALLKKFVVDVKGFAIKKVSVDNARIGKVELAEFGYDFLFKEGNFSNKMQIKDLTLSDTLIDMVLATTLPIGGSIKFADLHDQGISLSANLDMDVAYDDTNASIALKNVSLSDKILGGFTLSYTGSTTEFPRMFLTDSKLVIQDTGFGNLICKMFALMQGMSGDLQEASKSLRQSGGGVLGMQCAQLEQATAKEICSSLSKFVVDAGTLTITASPKEPVDVEKLFDSASSPEEIVGAFEVMGLKVTYSK